MRVRTNANLPAILIDEDSPLHRCRNQAIAGRIALGASFMDETMMLAVTTLLSEVLSDTWKVKLSRASSATVERRPTLDRA